MMAAQRVALVAALVGAVLAARVEAQPAAGSGVSVSTGLGYTSGDYSAPTKTEILVAPFSLRYRTGPLRLLATLPYVRIDSPGTVFGGVEGGPIIVDPETPMGRQVREGLGDLSLGATYTLPEATTGAFLVDLGARVKLPTSEKREQLGTGKTDITLSADVSRQFDRVAPFANVSYRFYGDPAAWDLRDGFATSVGTSVQAGRGVAILSYDYTRAASRFIGDAHELFAGYSGPAIDQLSWTAFGTAGLSEGAPDYGFGLLLTFRL